MRRAEPVHIVPGLTPDEHCAVHHFIRVHGRRPTPAELRRELSAVEPQRAASAVAVAGAVRREVARLLARL
ncbi:hypothetical protein [Nocardioides xinjiangensis]|uniref:hypothetical protein n=1 Tax=Nocardioides xinjiangensis TaxID=2817376 RepID=UPI001B304822|nr:hypothetical protein [Nocardioides sp. SYSU D00778]